MVAVRYPVHSIRPHRRGHWMEFMLAVAVIGGLIFVTYRVNHLGEAQTTTTSGLAARH